MKPRHLTWLVTAAALSAGLSAFAQQNPSGAAEAEPSRPGPEAAPTDTQDRDIRASGPEAAPEMDPSASTGTPMGVSPEDRAASGDDTGRAYERNGDAEQPKKKRSFWDRVTGRNKHLDAQDREDDGPAETGTGPETRPQP